ncbi:short chain dehydrogenase gsfK-like isoform X1 [Aquila chrysaetos chrysaetos]|uniref:short chain dehydrogenase gsfK-like isoform X1 n=1 Tax=Aquila chrysaetos chrysaetos TaxID=223781 RepID=UPI001B7D3654|nr:short chain dehydrogenase gsfK-like isoform X1 [Aquila chrysaetos chrysaetos]
MGELHVRSLLVTGANRGIGLELVRQFLGMPSPPAWVFAACRDPKGQRVQELQNLASKHPNLVIIPLEVTDPASIKAAAARVGEHLGGSGLNLLINNAGIAKASSLDNETLENMTQIYTTNTVGPLLLGQAFLPLLKKAAQGSPGSALNCSKAAIINMSSSAGSIEEVFLWNYGQVVSYRCSKAALNMLTKCQSLGYREHGILCAALHPGWVQTNMGGSGSQKEPEHRCVHSPHASNGGTASPAGTNELNSSSGVHKDGAGDPLVKPKKEVEIVEETFPSHPPATGVNPDGRGDKDGKPVAGCISNTQESHLQ